jgi:hypothetical protein
VNKTEEPDAHPAEDHDASASKTNRHEYADARFDAGTRAHLQGHGEE